MGCCYWLRPYRTRAAWVAALLATFALVALGGLVTEYVTAFGMAAAFVLVMLGLRSDARPDQARAFVAAATIAVAAIVGFIGLSLSKDPAFRPSTDSSFLLADGVFRFVKLPFYLATVWYQVVGGALLKELGYYSVEGYETIAATLLGAMLAVVTLFWAIGLRRSWNCQPARSGFRTSGAFAVIVLLGAVTIGVLPFLIMGRRPNDMDFSSRFYDPVLPFAATLTAIVVLGFLPRRATLAGLALIAFIAGYTTLSKAYSIHDEVKQLSRWGDVVREHLAVDGATIAIVPTGPGPRFRRMSDDELTCQLSRDWPLELRRNFWARGEPSALEPAESSMMRGARLEQPVTKVLLVQPGVRSDDPQIAEVLIEK